MKGYFRYTMYVLFMVIFSISSYIFLYDGINTKTKVMVNYQDESDVLYKVYLHSNDIYEQKYLNKGDKYVSELVDYIDFNFIYKSLFSQDISGYYSYRVDAQVVAYEEDINDSLWKKEYVLQEDIVNVIDKNGKKDININNNLIVDYDKYRNEIINFINDYDIDINGYLEIDFSLRKAINFDDINEELTEEEDIVKVIVPLTYKSFRINIIDNNSDDNEYYDFSNKEDVNYLFLILGGCSLIFTIVFIILIIYELFNTYNKESEYKKKLRKILKNHSDKIINVNRFYNKKKYNLIYVDSFNELLDVYDKVRNPISYREVKKNYEAVFVIIDEDNAWIYRMVAKNDKINKKK